MNRWKKGRFIILLSAVILIILFMNSNTFSKILYPVKYKEYINHYAEQYGINPLFVASIIRVESNFRPDRISKKGAIGLMQIMPDTAEWIIDRQQFAHFTLKHLENSADNINIGTWYIHSLINQFSGNTVAAAAAYNAGPGNVNKWLSSGQWDGSLEDSASIPFGETRHYVIRVHYYYDKYTQTYGNGL